MRFLYLFTEFPAPTETFYQREVRALHSHDAQFDAWSLWRGGSSFNGRSVHCFNKWRLLLVPFALLGWTVKRPRAVLGFFSALVRHKPPDLENAAQTLLGAAFAVLHARELEQRGYDGVHTAWANMPATAALCLKQLTGLPFTMGAHAYDIYRNGGDWLLAWKLREATAITTSSSAAERTLLERGAPPDRINVIRRGLDDFPLCREPRQQRHPLRALSVGRLVEKKGYDYLLDGYEAFVSDGATELEARVIGAGGLHAPLLAQRDALGLDDQVEFTGALPFEDVLAALAWADVFVFTGRVANDGNRDGFPNVLGEALAAGLPVIATPVSAVSEAIVDGETGLLLDPDDPTSLARALDRLAEDDALYARLRHGGRTWVERNFDASVNARRLLTLLEALHGATNNGSGVGAARGTP